MKRLIACCDGTWADADSAENFTNVVRICRAVAPLDDRQNPSIPQIVYYHSGVGTADAIGKTIGGGLGLGLSRNVRETYTFLANNYCEGDEIFLFGFSRGAYTARSIGGLLGYAGLLHKHDMDDFALLWEGYRLRDKPGQADIRTNFPDRHTVVPIKCIGVWDTVGSLGIPGGLDRIFNDFYQFHDTSLGAHVENAFHALALDERRVDFGPTLWQQLPAGKAAGQILRQVWFPGVHSNVGGGYEEHGLSDVTLAWMVDQVADFLKIDLDLYLRPKRDMRNEWGLGRIYDSAATDVWRFRGTKDRQPFSQPAEQSCESLHASVATRVQRAADSLPAAYHSIPLAGRDIGKLGQAPLGPIERQLAWQAADIGKPTATPRPAPGILSRVLHSFGGG